MEVSKGWSEKLSTSRRLMDRRILYGVSTSSEEVLSCEDSDLDRRNAFEEPQEGVVCGEKRSFVQGRRTTSELPPHMCGGDSAPKDRGERSFPLSKDNAEAHIRLFGEAVRMEIGRAGFRAE
mmetsp:Transcript_8895/g.13344  ORF Transcript_8895/g.13344 Transcript_8895/m.13344 type:complete len:122 (+) Transcript_8895:479-844(+)